MEHPEIMKIDDGKGDFIIINKRDFNKDEQKEWKPKQEHKEEKPLQEKRQQPKKDEDK